MKFHRGEETFNPIVEYGRRIVEEIGIYARDRLLEKYPLPRSSYTAMALPAVQFGPNDESKTTGATVQAIFLIRRLVISTTSPQNPKTASIAITSLFVGSDSCLSTNHPLTIAIFRADSVDSLLTFPVVEPGISISLGFQIFDPVHRVRPKVNYPLPIKSKISKAKFTKKNSQCVAMLSETERCPHPEGHFPFHVFPPASPAAPDEQILLFTTLMGEYLKPNDPRRYAAIR